MSNKPTLTEAIDTLLAEVLIPLPDSGLFLSYLQSWRSRFTWRDCLSTLKSGGWHTLKERKPADGEYCLLTLKTLKLSGAFGSLVPASVFEYNTGHFYREGDDGQDYERPQNGVIAWMPLPQPYRKES